MPALWNEEGELERLFAQMVEEKKQDGYHMLKQIPRYLSLSPATMSSLKDRIVTYKSEYKAYRVSKSMALVFISRLAGYEIHADNRDIR
jgi:3-methyladenine DNA glycosylase Tag